MFSVSGYAVWLLFGPWGASSGTRAGKGEAYGYGEGREKRARVNMTSSEHFSAAYEGVRDGITRRVVEQPKALGLTATPKAMLPRLNQ